MSWAVSFVVSFICVQRPAAGSRSRCSAVLLDSVGCGWTLGRRPRKRVKLLARLDLLYPPAGDDFPFGKKQQGGSERAACHRQASTAGGVVAELTGAG